jgi:hypothetical protein
VIAFIADVELTGRWMDRDAAQYRSQRLWCGLGPTRQELPFPSAYVKR